MSGLIEITRDVLAIMIPDGNVMTLKKGTNVSVQQSLGGAYTLMTDHGFMVRISVSDADVIGETPETITVDQKGTDPESVKEAIWEMMKTCYDPEIPVNIVDLGLIYDCKVETVSGGKNKVSIQMTLTAPGCGMGPVLQSDVELRVKSLDGVDSVNVEVVFDPPWDREMMSEVAKLELGLM